MSEAAVLDLQQRIDTWCKEQFPEQTALTILQHLREEVVELRARGSAEEAADCLILLLAWAAHTHAPLLADLTPADLARTITLNVGELIYAQKRNAVAVGMAQHVLISLLAWAVLSDVNLLAAAEAKHAVNLTREWRRGPDGIHHHHIERDSEAAE